MFKYGSLPRGCIAGQVISRPLQATQLLPRSNRYRCKSTDVAPNIKLATSTAPFRWVPLNHSSARPLIFDTPLRARHHEPLFTSISHVTRCRGFRRRYVTGKISDTQPPVGDTSPFQQALYFKPATWVVLALAFAVAGAASTIMSVSDFIAYTDEESLLQFQPSRPSEIKIEQYINQHPLTKSLRSNPDFTESRPTLKVHEQYRDSSLTSGVLAGQGKIEVPPFVWSEKEGKSLVSVFYIGSELCGYPGLVHGGLLATILDEGLARCCFPALPNHIGMTASLTINYRKPTPSENFLVLRAKTVKVEGRKAWVEGQIETLPRNGEEPVVLVEASALMIEPKQAKLFAPLIPVR